MNEKIKGIFEKVKNPKIIVIIGLLGIVLIFLSSLFSDDDSTPTLDSTEPISTERYCNLLEEKVKGIVYNITGDKKAFVAITLESGIRYSYADALQSDNTVSSGKESEHSSESTVQSYITVKTSDGGEKALIVTEYMPEVKGVAVICKGGDSEQLSQKIENAVTAALNITSKRVYIAGGTIK